MRQHENKGENKTVKKTFAAAILFGILILCLILPAHADGFGVTLSASASHAEAGESITFTVSLSGAPAATSGSIALHYDDSRFAYVSSSWSKSDAVLNAFDAKKNKGAIAFSSATDLNGTYFTFTLKAKAAAAGAQTVSASVQVAGSEAGDSVSISFASACASHSFGNWQQTTAPTCEGKGVETRTCSACGAVETRNVAALGHDFEDPGATREPTLSEPGLLQGRCRRCGETVEEEIPPLGADEDAESSNELTDDLQGVLTTGIDGDYDDAGGTPVTVWIAAAVAAVIAAGVVYFLLRRKKRA